MGVNVWRGQKHIYQVSGVRCQGETRGPTAIIWTCRILRSIKITNYGSLKRMHSYLEWIRENIGAESPGAKTPLAVR
jgi:hypothetical protein